ncbi:MAG: hypothetical protein FJZ88_06965, partial [Chloroflexi bacterium]|nr:hypothetical protein [Chloroflexota bacterium]
MSERILEARQLLLNAAREGDVQAVRDSLSQVLREEDLTEADLLSIVQKLTQFGMHKEALGWLQEPVEDVEAWQSDLVLAL